MYHGQSGPSREFIIKDEREVSKQMTINSSSIRPDSYHDPWTDLTICVIRVVNGSIDNVRLIVYSSFFGVILVIYYRRERFSVHKHGS